MKHLGIDYGSKLAGTTALCWIENDELIIRQSEKKKDADQIILQICKSYQPDFVFLDAPLSLPGVYSDSDQYSDYFYRQCDRELKAMSPMFIGGLTARAMKLADILSKMEIEVIEAYPAGAVEVLGLGRHYKNDIINFLNSIAPQFPSLKLPEASNWHQVDSLLAWLIGLRYRNGESKIYGQVEEGQIFV